MDSRFTALADRYSKIDPEPEQNKCMPKFGTEFLHAFSNIDDLFNSLDGYYITGEHDYNWSKDCEKEDSTVYFVEKNLIKEYIDSQHVDEGEIKSGMDFINIIANGDVFTTSYGLNDEPVTNESNDRFRTKIKQTIQNTALSGDTCW